MKLWILLVVSAILVACSHQQATTTNTVPPVATQQPSSNEATSNDGSSRYQEYSMNAYNQASGKRRVLYFYASWCPTCRPADADFKANMTSIPEDVVVLRVNYNDPETDQEEKDLAQKYGITYQHTFVQIDASGNQVAKWNGGQTAELLSKIK